jgi:hypothetical protein
MIERCLGFYVRAGAITEAGRDTLAKLVTTLRADLGGGSGGGGDAAVGVGAPAAAATAAVSV